MLIVQCDFDDTVTVGNVSTAIREVFGPDDWVKMEEEYYSGKYSVEESNVRQYGLIRASQEEIENFVLGSVVIRYAFDQFVEYCGGEGIRLVIVSSGLDLYINPTLQQMGFDRFEVYSGKAEAATDGAATDGAATDGATDRASVVTTGV